MQPGPLVIARLSNRRHVSDGRQLFARVCALALCGGLVLLPARKSAASATSAAALTVSKRALQAYRAKRYQEAAGLYRAAWMTHHKELRYLYNAARAAQLAGLLRQSQRDYVDYLMKVKGHGSAVRKARVHLEEVRAALRAQRAAIRRAKGPTTTASGARGRVQRPERR